jgi:hypothetical protein
MKIVFKSKLLYASLMILFSACKQLIEPTQLALSLEKDSLYKKFDGYVLSPRSGDVYIFLSQDPFVDYFIEYDSRGPSYISIGPTYTHYQDSIRQVDSVLFHQRNEYYIGKAYELITIMKSFGIEAVNSVATFDCKINDSLNLRYYPDTSSHILDPHIFIDQKRIDKYFIVYK